MKNEVKITIVVGNWSLYFKIVHGYCARCPKIWVVWRVKVVHCIWQNKWTNTIKHFHIAWTFTSGLFPNNVIWRTLISCQSVLFWQTCCRPGWYRSIRLLMCSVKLQNVNLYIWNLHTVVPLFHRGYIPRSPVNAITTDTTFYMLKVYSNPALSKSVGAIFLTIFAHVVSLCQILIIFTLSNVVIILW